MEPDDLLCSRNARPQTDEKGAARCPSCAQNAHGERDGMTPMLIPCSRSAHDQNVLARRPQWDQHGCHSKGDRQASLEGSFLWFDARSKGQPRPLPLRKVERIGRPSLGLLARPWAKRLSWQTQGGWAGEKVAHTRASIRPHPSLSQALSEKLNVPVFRIQTWTWLLQIDLIGRAPSAAERNEHTLIREIL